MSNPTNPAPIARRTTLDGHRVEIDASGCLAHAYGTFTRHAGLPLPVALEVAEAVSLFVRAEMPALMAAASRMARSGRPVAFWALVAAASTESARQGTRPAELAPAPVPAAPRQAWGAIDGRVGPVYLDGYGVLRHG